MVAHLQRSETFHRARSELIDAFARLECRAVQALARFGCPIKGDTLGSKIKTLRAKAENATHANSEASFDQLLELVTIRADIVHGEMVLIDIDGSRYASFRNAREAAKTSQRASLISYAGLMQMIRDLDAISSSLIDF